MKHMTILLMLSLSDPHQEKDAPAVVEPRKFFSNPQRCEGLKCVNDVEDKEFIESNILEQYDAIAIYRRRLWASRQPRSAELIITGYHEIFSDGIHADIACTAVDYRGEEKVFFIERGVESGPPDCIPGDVWSVVFDLESEFDVVRDNGNVAIIPLYLFGGAL